MLRLVVMGWGLGWLFGAGFPSVAGVREVFEGVGVVVAVSVFIGVATAVTSEVSGTVGVRITVVLAVADAVVVVVVGGATGLGAEQVH